MTIDSAYLGIGMNVFDVETKSAGAQVRAPFYTHFPEIARYGGYTLEQFDDLDRPQRVYVSALWLAERQATAARYEHDDEERTRKK